MFKSNFLKTASTLIISGGLFLTGASADHRRDNVGRTIWQIEKSSGALVGCFRHELESQGLWKPRGAYASLYKRLAVLERQGDNLVKYYRRGESYHYLAKALAIVDTNVHESEDLARRLRVSRETVSGIRQVAAMVHTLNGLCGDRYQERRTPRYDSRRDSRRSYESRRSGRYTDRYRSPNVRLERPLREIARRIF